MTGVEGYVESASSGFVAGINAALTALGQESVIFPKETEIGALAHYVSEGGVSSSFQPPPQTYMVLPTGSVARRKKSRMDTVSGTVVGGTVVGGTVVGDIVVGGAVVGVTVVGGVVVAGTVVGVAGWAQPQSNSIISATHKIRFIADLLFLFHFPLDYSTK